MISAPTTFKFSKSVSEPISRQEREIQGALLAGYHNKNL